ncbi:MAG: MauE/DoxX family redox-associated membrane protein [Phycisphaeraceae bacterium]
MLGWVPRLIIAAVLVLAAVPKIAAPHDFARVIYHYQLLSDAWINPVAIILPWLELVLAGALLLRRWHLPAATLAIILLMVFVTAETSAYFRGLNIACGCFSVDAGASPLTIWSLLRDGGLLLVALMIVMPWRRSSPASARVADGRVTEMGDPAEIIPESSSGL